MCNKTTPKHPNLFHKTVIREHCNKKVKRKKYLKNALTHTRHDTHKSANISRNFSSENPNAASHVPCRVCDIFLVSCKFHQAVGDDAAGGDSDTVQNVTRERHAQRNAFDIWQSPQCTVGRASRQRAKGRALYVFFPNRRVLCFVRLCVFLHLFQFFSSYICTLL